MNGKLERYFQIQMRVN